MSRYNLKWSASVCCWYGKNLFVFSIRKNNRIVRFQKSVKIEIKMPTSYVFRMTNPAWQTAMQYPLFLILSKVLPSQQLPCSQSLSIFASVGRVSFLLFFSRLVLFKKYNFKYQRPYVTMWLCSGNLSFVILSTRNSRIECTL